MKIAILLKNGPSTDEAGRALQTAGDMLNAGYDVHLVLLQEAVRFCQPRPGFVHSARFQALTAERLKVSVMATDAGLRGIDVSAAGSGAAECSYESLVDLMTSSDRVVGIL